MRTYKKDEKEEISCSPSSGGWRAMFANFRLHIIRLSSPQGVWGALFANVSLLQFPCAIEVALALRDAWYVGVTTRPMWFSMSISVSGPISFEFSERRQ